MLFTERARIEEIIHNCLVCHLALSRDDQPYVLPISFGYDGECLYFHTGFVGQKIDTMEANPRVCFEFEDSVAVAPNLTDPCKTGLTYRSVIGYGRVEHVEDRAAKQHGLNVMMGQYGQAEHAYTDEALDGVRVWRIVIERMTGKAGG